MLSALLAVAETPQSLAHWVRLADGSLLVGHIENIDSESFRIDLRLEPKTVLTIPRQHVVAVIVIPPVDPALAEKLLASLENEAADTIHLVDGRTLSGRLRSFSKGIFRFDLSFGGPAGLFLESQPISWRRIRSIYLLQSEKERAKGEKVAPILLKNGSKIVSTDREDRENGSVVVKNSCFPDLELPFSSLISPHPGPHK